MPDRRERLVCNGLAGRGDQLANARRLQVRERAHQRCKDRGIPCSDMQLVDWNEQDGVRAFFAEVGGILFEVMRVEAKT